MTAQIFEQVKLESISEKGSYGIGLQIGQQLADSQMDISVEAVAKGIFDALNRNQPALEINDLMHYTGTLPDGTVFDSSVARGAPAEFPVNGVIRGWVEALQMMPVGSKWKLTIPPELAYGERGAGASIPPFSTLVFEVELLDIL